MENSSIAQAAIVLKSKQKYQLFYYLHARKQDIDALSQDQLKPLVLFHNHAWIGKDHGSQAFSCFEFYNHIEQCINHEKLHAASFTPINAI